MKNQIAQSNFGKCLKLSVVLFLGLMLGTLLPGGGRAFAQSTNSIFGPNVTIISSGTSEANIEAALTNIAGSTYTSNPTGGQFSTNRSAVLFMPGTYTVQAPIGYYTSIAGLGQNPGDVVINGFITPNFGAWSTWCTGNCPQVSLDTYFWRSMENMTINAVADANQGDSVNELQWGVSQGAPLRRMQINGGLELTNTYCGEASGGFTADTQVTATVNSCSQTQWYTRNSSIGSWSSGVWNMVFSGVTGAPTPNYPANSYTVLPTTPVTREKPFLYVDGGGNFWVFSPTLRTNSSSTSWSTSSPGPGNSLAISTFFIATPSSALADINTALAAGQNLILTPGIYQYSGSINVTNPNTVVLGLGYADIVPQTGTPAITVADVDGVQIAGLLIDAGPVNSPILLQVGVAGTDTGVSHASNPTSINDVFFRIGGATVGTATESLEVDSENVILDNIWAWRADHGNTGTTGWTVNTAANGLVVNGANVTALGLAAEHYQQSQVVWNGEGGETVFLESELPYDVPSQAGWMDGAVNGYPAYYVAPTVTTHTTYGLGVYSNFNQGVSIVDTSAISVPNAVGVTATDSVSVFLGGSGSITYTIDAAGTPVNSSSGTSYVPFYQGTACTTTCPAAATNLTATLTYPSGSLIPQIALAWTSGATTNAVYTIYRGSTPNFTPSVANQLVAGISNATTTYTDTSVTNGSGYYYVVQSQTLGGVAYSNVASVGIPAAGGVITTDVVAINAGGPAIAGTSWAADKDVTGGGTENNGAATVTIPVGMVGAAPQAVYQTMHNGAFTYAIPGLNAGQTYIVNLHFNEDWVGIPTNGRIFNIFINGSTVLSNFQIFVAAGGSNVANIQSFTATADSTGTITVAATAVTNNPIISGIEIGTGTLAGSPTGTTPPVQPVGLNAALPPTTGIATSALPVTLTWIASSTPGVTYTVYRSTASGFTPSTATQIVSGVTSTAFEDYSASGGTTYYYLVQAVGTGGTINSNQATATTGEIEVMSSDVFDINCGTDTTNVPGTLGVNWAPDASAATTVPSNPTAPGFTVSGGGTDQYGTTVVPAGLIDAAPALVYQTFHSGVFTYTIFGLTPSTQYLVNLHLAEDYFSLPNQRVYSLIVNGVTVLPDYDAVAATGAAHIANVQAVNAQSDSNGTITVSTSALINSPLLAGIEVGFGVLPGSPTGPNPPAQPTHLAATAISAAQVNLSWNPSSTAGVTYGVFRSITTGFTPSTTNQLAAGLTATTYVDSTVSPSTTYYYLVQALASDNVSTTNSNQASATTGVIVQDVFNINTGTGTSTTVIPGILGVAWLPDVDALTTAPANPLALTAPAFTVSGGGPDPIDTSVTIPAGLAGAAPLAVYQTEHSNPGTYTIYGLTPSQPYFVALHFNEDWSVAGTNPGTRVFDVQINGTTVLSSFDIGVAAGGAHIANVQTFPSTADANGEISITFVANQNNPLISGIEIGTAVAAAAGPGAPTGLTASAISGGEIDLSWTASSTSGVTYSVFRSATSGFTPAPANQIATGLTATTYKDLTVSGGTTYYYMVQAVESGGTANSNQASATTPTSQGEITADVVDINAGGGEVNGMLGVNWAADEYFTGGTVVADNTLITIPAGLVNAAPEAVYQTNRYGSFSYAVPGLTPNGSYIVDLHFEENYWPTAGSRIFNVSINGTQVLTNFDIVAAAGANHTANIQSFAVSASGTGTMNILFIPVKDNPLVCGIEIGTGIVGVIPSPPSALNATAASSSEIDLSWTASPTANVTYSVFGSTTNGFTPGSANLLASGLTTTTYNNTGLTAATTYYYAVEAVSSGITSAAIEASATTLPPPCTTVPAVPGSLSANAASAAEVDLAWGASFAPVGCTVTYNVYRSTTSGFAPSSGNLLTTSAVSEPFYDDTASLTASTTYYYVVEAVDLAGSSASSGQANATTLPTGATLWTQVWGDDFTGAAGTTYDHTKWWNEIAENTGNQWGDGTIQSTSDSLQNVYLDGNGHLVEAMTYNPTPGAGQTAYTSARLHSIQNIGYGRIDASIQNPSAPGMGAALWAMGSDLFLPGTHNEAGATPWPWCGELDMMELQASNPAHNGSTIHGGETDGGTQYEYEGVSVGMNLPGGEPNFDQGFHTITTLWGPYHVQYFMDGVQYGDVNLANLGATDIWPLMGPSDNYTINLIISSGIGGNGGTPGTTGFPSNYTFDYVHYSTLTSGVPSPVTNLTASQVYSNAVQLSWAASATSDVTYNIYASTTPNAKLDLSTLIEQNASATSFLAGGLTPGTTYFFTVLASNWGGESSNATVTATTSAIGNSTGVQLSAGSYAVGSYINSQYVLGGNTNYHYGNVVDTSLVANPAPAEVYTTERWGAAAWTITGLNPKAGYNVRLHFVEAAHTAAGQRNFNVTINSATVLNNFDIFATAGAANKAITQEFYTQADENGIIELQTLYGNSSAGDLNPTVSAIEVVPTGSGNPPVGSLVGAAPGTTTDLAIASGDSVAVGKFVADEDFTDGDSNAPYPYTATVTLNSNSAPQGVYDYERYTPFTYVLTGLVADTPYAVNLHFAEMYWNGPGDRIFNVVINGNTVLPNLDVYKVTGGMDIAYDPQFIANADMYGQIILQFTYGGADQPFINGLEATQVTTPQLTSPTPGAVLGTTNVTFSWTSGAGGVYAYDLYLGTTGQGSHNLYNSAGISTTSVTIPSLPSIGATVYARLWYQYRLNGPWQFTDYTYTESPSAPAVLTSPTPGSVLGTSNVAFSWTPGAGVTAYDLYLGTTGVGSTNLYNSTAVTTTSVTVPALPSLGATIYVRLSYRINGTWQSTDYTYTESPSAPAVLTSPTPGSVLGTSNVVFSWTPGAGVTAYDLYLGTTGVGSTNLYNSAAVTTTSVTVATLPSLGATVYARLSYRINGTWQSTDYTYTESPSAPAVLTSPTPGSVLGATNVVFSWTPGAGVTAYDFYLGTTGVGSSNLYNSGGVTTTSFTATTLPSIGATIYTRLSYRINGVWQSTDYTYTESPSAPAVLTSPTPGSVLGTTNVVFSWTPGAGVTVYDLYLGTTAGSANLYNSASVTTTSVTVPTLPSKGATVYVRLWYRINGTWQFTDYTYTEQ